MTTEPDSLLTDRWIASGWDERFLLNPQYEDQHRAYLLDHPAETQTLWELLLEYNRRLMICLYGPDVEIVVPRFVLDGDEANAFSPHRKNVSFAITREEMTPS